MYISEQICIELRTVCDADDFSIFNIDSISSWQQVFRANVCVLRVCVHVCAVYLNRAPAHARSLHRSFVWSEYGTLANLVSHPLGRINILPGAKMSAAIYFATPFFDADKYFDGGGALPWIARRAHWRNTHNLQCRFIFYYIVMVGCWPGACLQPDRKPMQDLRGKSVCGKWAQYIYIYYFCMFEIVWVFDKKSGILLIFFMEFRSNNSFLIFRVKYFWLEIVSSDLYLFSLSQAAVAFKWSLSLCVFMQLARHQRRSGCIRTFTLLPAGLQTQL